MFFIYLRFNRFNFLSKVLFMSVFIISLWKFSFKIFFIPFYNARLGYPRSRTTDAQWSLFSSKFQIYFGPFGVFWADLSAPILVLWVLCPCFLLIKHYFYNKLSLYIQIPNVYLGLRFEFGPQRIRDLAFVCP